MEQVLLLAFAAAALNGVCSILTEGLGHLENYHMHKAWQVMEKPLRDKIQHMDYARVEDGETHTRLHQIRSMRMTMGYGLPRLYYSGRGLINGIFKTAFSVSLLAGAFTAFHTADGGSWRFLFSPWTAAGVILFMAAGIALNLILVKKDVTYVLRAFESFRGANRLGGYYYETLTRYHGGQDIKLYAMGDAICAHLNAQLVEMADNVMTKAQRHNANTALVTTTVNHVITGVVYIYVALKALFGSFGVGNIVQYAGCLLQLSGGIANVVDELGVMGMNAEALDAYFRFIDMPDVKYAGTLPVEKRAFCENGDNEYRIEFRDVSFRYPGSEQYALSHLNMELKIGERMAVVGENGSGKTTFIKLLCRLYDPTEGEILLNGVDIRKYDYEEYLSLFSVVFQDFQLFAFPLGQNVATGVEYDGKKLADCLQRAGLHLRPGFDKDTCLYKDFDEMGVEISGGEAQKIALARALYKDAPFVILDEPTAALDPIAEAEVYSRFDAIAGSKTAVYISHRLSSCRFCDDIAVFHEGKLIQRGSHGQLLEREGQYRRLWQAQAQYYAPQNT